MIFKTLLDGQENLLVLLSAFIIGGIFKSQGIFMPVFTMLSEKIKSKRLALMAVSLVSGVLPVEGRVSMSAPILDSLVQKNHSERCGSNHARGKLGILDFIATHHYYLWSPLEKSVIILMAGLSLTYMQLLSYTLVPVAVYLIFLAFIVFKYIDEKDIVIQKLEHKEYNWKHILNVVPFFAGLGLSIFLPPYYVFPVVAGYYYVITTDEISMTELFSFIKWNTLFFVAIVIVVANLVKSNSDLIHEIIKNPNQIDFLTMSVLIAWGALASLALGSSGKYVGICVTLTLILGMKYFPIIFMVEYCAYLLSPTHKCLVISASYFDTKIIEFYKYIAILVILMMSSGVTVYLFSY